MQFEGLSEEVQQEIQRVAMAFEVEEYKELAHTTNLYAQWCGHIANVLIKVNFYLKDATLYRIWIGDSDSDLESLNLDCIGGLKGRDIMWLLWGGVQYRSILARALYRLGFEDTNVLSQLPEINAHEKMELRLSMPGEFWPKTWREEDS